MRFALACASALEPTTAMIRNCPPPVLRGPSYVQFMSPGVAVAAYPMMLLQVSAGKTWHGAGGAPDAVGALRSAAPRANNSVYRMLRVFMMWPPVGTREDDRSFKSNTDRRLTHVGVIRLAARSSIRRIQGTGQEANRLCRAA